MTLSPRNSTKTKFLLTKTPHVDGSSVGQAEDDLWRAVEARLDVGEHSVVSVTRTAKVDHFDACAAPLLQQHVFLKSQIVSDWHFLCRML